MDGGGGGVQQANTASMYTQTTGDCFKMDLKN